MEGGWESDTRICWVMAAYISQYFANDLWSFSKLTRATIASPGGLHDNTARLYRKYPTLIAQLTRILRGADGWFDKLDVCMIN